MTTVLELGIDASGVASAGAQAASALGGISQAAALATSSLAASSQAMAGLSSALTVAMPWISAIGAALSGITTGILLFSQRTKEATDEWTKFTDSMARAEAIEALGGMFFGQGGDQSAMRQRALFQRAATLQEGIFAGTAETVYAGELGERLNLRSVDVIQTLLDAGNLDPDRASSLRNRLVPNAAALGPRFSPDNVRVTPEEQIAALSEIARREQRRTALQSGERFPGLTRPGFSSFSLQDELMGSYRDPFGLRPGQAVGTGTVLISPGQQNAIDSMLADRDAAQRMAEIRDYALEIGAALGDGAWDFMQGISSAGDVLGNIMSMVGRDLMRNLAQQFTGGLAELFAPAG